MTMDPKMNAHDEVTIKLEAIELQVAYLVERQKKTEELFTEMTPILREVMSTAIEKLDTLEKKGYFAFGRELVSVGERIVDGFKPDDVRQLGDAVVGILEAVRAVTQPRVLEIANEAAAALEASDSAEPIGLLGMVRSTGDHDVQKGMSVMMQVMRHVGRAARAVHEQQKADPRVSRKRKLEAVLGSRKKVLGVERKPAPKSASCAVPSNGPAAVATVIDGVAFGADGHLANAKDWTPALAEKLAAMQQLTLDDARWALIKLAREEFERTSTSPNIRRLTQLTNIATKDVYALFPKAPARTVAKIAGTPKPAGCI